MANAAEENNQEDLGLGQKVIEENRTRFINKDGSFNVFRKGALERGSFSPYHAILRASWWRFNLGVIGYYVVANFLFTFLYLAAGRSGFPDIAGLDALHRFGQLFFYSVQIITTLGTSPLHPANTFADAVLAVEAMIGMLGFAIGASLFFARFANPAAKVMFSKTALLAPYRGGTAFMFRIINGRSNELVNVSVKLTLSMTESDGKRHTHLLHLERESVLVFPLSWTIVHPIDASSPLAGLKLADLAARQAEFLISLSATDEDLSKTIYVRSSYVFAEVREGLKFKSILEHTADGTIMVDPHRISETETV